MLARHVLLTVSWRATKNCFRALLSLLCSSIYICMWAKSFVIYMPPMLAQFALSVTSLMWGNVPGHLLLNYTASTGKLGKSLGTMLVTWYSFCVHTHSEENTKTIGDCFSLAINQLFYMAWDILEDTHHRVFNPLIPTCMRRTSTWLRDQF